MLPYGYNGRTHRALAFLEESGPRPFGAIAQAVHGADLTKKLRKKLWRLIDHLFEGYYLDHVADEGYRLSPDGEALLEQLRVRPTVRVFARAA